MLYSRLSNAILVASLLRTDKAPANSDKAPANPAKAPGNLIKKSQLDVLEIVSEGDSKLDLTLRNSGDLVAYVNGMQLVFGPMSCGSNVCMIGLGFTRYKFDVRIRNGRAEVLHHAAMEIESREKIDRTSIFRELKAEAETMGRETHEVPSGPNVENKLQKPKNFEVLSPEQAAAELRNESTSMSDTVYTGDSSEFLSGKGFELLHMTVKKSPILRTSLPINPNEVQRVKLDLEFLGKELYLSTCINTCSLKAYGLIFYDSDKVIRTSDFHFTFTNLK